MPQLREIQFRDLSRSAQNLARLVEGLSEEGRERLLSLVAVSADPDGAVHYLERFEREQRAAFDRLAASASGFDLLVPVFSQSHFLSEAVLIHPDWIEELTAPGSLDRIRTKEDFEERLERALAEPGPPSPHVLALFRRRQLLRILLRDVLAIGELPEVAEELSSLADAVLEVTYQRLRDELAARHGLPSDPRFSILSLGKLGGQELNYSSDIDLLFLYAASGQTAGPERITNKEFFGKLAHQLTGLLSTYTAAGLCYRVDLRLRPDGRYGEVCSALDGARNYYQTRARDWELQMLIKARVSAGDTGLGQNLMTFVEPLIYSSSLDFGVVEAASETRMRISEKLAARRGGNQGFDIKLAPGGIRDIEFLVQCLQRLHGGRERWVRHGGTLLALSRLRDKDLLSGGEYSRLASAYEFLRELEHRLQFDEDRQIHTLPKDPDELARLARRMPWPRHGEPFTTEALLSELNRHLEDVRELYERVIHAQQPIYYGPAENPAEQSAAPEPVSDEGPEPALSNLVRYLDQRAPQLAQVVARTTLRRGRIHFEHFLEKALPNAEWMAWLDGDALLAKYLLDLFEHSPFFAEQMIRAPELLRELRQVRQGVSPALPLAEEAASLDDTTELRRFFQREMFRIQAGSICREDEIFGTLARTSDLADAVIAAAFRMAIEQVADSHPPAAAGYEPADRMMVITMGRLGMREFDLASDADLIFVLPDRDASEAVFWTRVAERLIALITAYTGEGAMFAVDTRLRPNGKSGALVQTESAYKSYFGGTAQAWEGISYMKCRAAAGNLDRGTRFLHELQQVDWRRYGQSGRSKKQLLAMRLRLEKEQGGGNALKIGRGGYYDIDFALMYLRLKAAGLFFKVLNTPERIDVVEQTGHLERPDAEFLRDAATFYRAVDHALRVASGHTEGNLPAAGAQLEILNELVKRWTPDYLHDQPLDIELAQIQARTREFFDRLFQI